MSPSPNIGGTCPPCPIGIDAPVSELFLNGTSAQNRPFSATSFSTFDGNNLVNSTNEKWPWLLTYDPEIQSNIIKLSVAVHIVRTEKKNSDGNNTVRRYHSDSNYDRSILTVFRAMSISDGFWSRGQFRLAAISSSFIHLHKAAPAFCQPNKINVWESVSELTLYHHTTWRRARKQVDVVR